MKNKFPVKGWRWIFYIIGLITGIGSPLFWFILLLLHFGDAYEENSEKRFFGNKFHERTVWWGVGVMVFIILMFLRILFEVY
ncbi:hypothetical protein HOE07_04240 [archaeon]|jgi:hypothetical protein|nr:hypothetical protein [archaeon]